ncbi:MAG: murein L,D-transpeptidase [Chitinophagales bacterium]
MKKPTFAPSSFMRKLTANFLFLLFSALIFSCKKTTQKDEVNIADPPTIDSTFHALQFDSTTLNLFFQTHELLSFHKIDILNFYKNRNYKFAWFNENGMLEQGSYFMNLLNHFDEEGLKDSIVYVSENQKLFSLVTDPGYFFRGADSITAQLDMLLTSQFFVYAQKVWSGISEQQTKELNWYIKRKTIPFASILDSILTGKGSSFTANEPVYKQYNLLKQNLKKYKTISKELSSWDSLKLPTGVKFYKEGDSAEIIGEIQNRLILFGDLSEKSNPGLFDSATAVAVKKLQKRFGLKQDGAAGNNFFDAINTHPDSLLRKIVLNMERCRWVPYDLKGEYITVNIPEYKMHIYDNDSLVWDMNVIVGKSSTSTTIFNDYLEYIIFSPYWEVPNSIVSKEIVPAVKKNISYLTKNRFEVVNTKYEVLDPTTIDWQKYSGSNFPYFIRQKPGADNALGWVKFIFPNSYSIYFHDTDSRSLFSQTQRSLSHGCIRVAEPQRFAEYLLREDSIAWPKEKIDSVMHSGKPTKVLLKEKIPVFIAYFTAWVDDTGDLNFRKDIYGHDAKLEETLR